MTNRICIRVQPPSRKRSRQNADRVSWSTDYFHVVMVIAAVMLAFLLRSTKQSSDNMINRSWDTALSSLLANDHTLPSYGSLILLLCITTLLLWAVVLSVRRAVVTRNENQAAAEKDVAVVTIYPVGIQVTKSGGRNLCFIPRDRIIDFRVREIILAHRVYSCACVLYKVDDNDGREKYLELFPELELKHVECISVCRKLRAMLRQC